MQAVLHEQSSSVPLPKFDLFGVPPTQTMIERDIVTEHRPITTLDPSSFIQFEIPTSIDEYIDLEKIYFYLKIKVKKIDSVNAEADWDDISPVNYLLHSMIKQLDIFIGDKQITSSSSTYAFKAYIEALFGFSEEAKKSHLTSALWFDDTVLKVEGPLKDRNDAIKNYAICDLYGRLHTDLAFQGRSLLGGSKLIVRILLNEPNFYMMSHDHTPELEFLDASLHVHRAKVPQMIVEAHNAALQISTAKYPFTMSKVKSFTIPKGVSDANIDNLHSGQLPRRIFVFFVLNDAFCGKYIMNPFKFEHFNINSLVVHMDGVQYPSKPYTPDFTNGIYQREMVSLYEALDMIDGEPNIKFNRDNFKTGNVIFGFNFSPDLTSGVGAIGHLSPIRYGSLRLSVRFSTALLLPITCLVYCEFDKMLEIDINRQAHIDMI